MHQTEKQTVCTKFCHAVAIIFKLHQFLRDNRVCDHNTNRCGGNVEVWLICMLFLMYYVQAGRMVVQYGGRK
jgi:hypothetical protein